MEGLGFAKLALVTAYTHDYDTNGILYLLGTMPPMPPNVQPGTWINPAIAGRVLVHCGDRGYIAFDGLGDDEEWRTAPIAKELVIDRQVEGLGFRV